MKDSFAGYARFYDMDYEGVDGDLPMIQQFAARCGSPILELGCGTGRVLLPLARQGFRVTGIDASTAMLDQARRKLAAEGLLGNVSLVQDDMRDIDLDERFRLALIVSNSFLHLQTTDDQVNALSRIRNQLDDGGLLVLDVFNPDLGRLLDVQGRITLDKVMVEPHTGRRLTKFLSQSVDLGQQIIEVTIMVDEIGAQGQVQRTLFAFPLRYLFRGEMELLLRHTGFELEALYGSHDLDPFSGESERMIAVAWRAD